MKNSHMIFVVLMLFGWCAEAQNKDCKVCDFSNLDSKVMSSDYWGESTGRASCEEFLKVYRASQPEGKRVFREDKQKSDRKGEQELFLIYSTWIRGYLESLNQYCGNGDDQFYLGDKTIIKDLADRCRSGNQSDAIGGKLRFLLKDKVGIASLGKSGKDPSIRR